MHRYHWARRGDVNAFFGLMLDNVAVMLILGGIVLLWVDRRPERPRYEEAMDFTLPMAFKVGLFQCLALVPGVSRSGATIVGALLLGASKRSAAVDEGGVE